MLEEHSIFKALRTSKYYFYFTVLQLLLTLILLIMAIFFPQAGYCIYLELTITILLIADLSLKKLTDAQFFQKCRNIADLIMLISLIVFLMIELYYHSAFSVAQEIGSLLLILRYGLQLYRIFSLAWQSKETDLLHRLEDIRLDDLQISDQIEVNRLDRKQPKAH